MTKKKFFVNNNPKSYVNAGFLEDKNDLVVKTLQSHVPDNERDDQSVKPLSYFSLFRYSTSCEKCIIVLAIFLAILSGCAVPIINVLYGEFANLMVDRQYPTDAPSTKVFFLSIFGGGKILQNASREERKEALKDDSRAWGLGCASFTLLQFIFSMVSVFLLNFTASRQISRIKILFFKSTVCKDMAWFDTCMDGNFAGKAFDNLNQLEAGIGGILGIFAYLLMIFGFGVVTAFYYGWKLTLAILSTVPISLGISSVMTKIQSKLTLKEMTSYTKAGNVAEEVFSSIRVVTAFEGEKKEVERYAKNLEESKSCEIKKGMAAGITGGMLWLIIYSSYAVAFAYGVRLIQQSKENGDDEYTPAGLLIIFFGILTGLTNLGFASAHLETFAAACGAAASVFGVINSKVAINPCSEEGKTGEDFRGEIEFKNVHFQYPSRPSVKILKGVNLKIKAGEVVAIVGGSGAGKSTILQLVQRLYDPSQGEILIDGQNIKSLKVSWLRQQLGVVGQEPALFATTIRENIWYGFSLATDKDVIKAAQEANAHDFIMKLKEDYDTVIGQKGSTLSGGQKQRIAIARALIRNPKILLLDEATSALDASSEKIVQMALDKAAKGRTTIIVTHRLSTIANVNRIIVLANGTVAEEGTHDELVKANGIYLGLLKSQSENFKVTIKKTHTEEVLPNQVIYEDHTVLPPGPRSRYSTPSVFSLLSKGPGGVSLEDMSELSQVTLWDILKWNKPEWIFLFIGSLASVICGAALPIVCVLFGSLFGLLSMTDSNTMLKQTDFFAVILVAVGIIAGICVFLQMYCFTVAGMRLTTRLRIKAFDCTLKQEIGWFDDEKNKVGALCLRLSQDASGIQGAVGSRLGILMQAFSTMTIGAILSFFFDWKMTVVTLATIPLVFSGVYIESMFIRGPNVLANHTMEAASKIAIEIIANVKAVASLSKEKFFIDKYSLAVRDAKKRDTVKAWVRGFAFAVGQTAPFFGYAISLWFGGLLVANDNLEYKYVIMISEVLIFGAWTLGQSVIFAPSFREAKAAAGRLQYIFSRKPHVADGAISYFPDITKNGFITYSKVRFTYPTRPATEILRNLNIVIKAGESVAIMGPSGSGKSTIIQLLLRFYNPNSGNISINNISITDYKLSTLRRRLGLVSQEPVLFDRTIEENIAYGDNSRIVPLSEVIEAAKSANIHSFIASLPQGYNTKLGTGGTQLSGGQKQRIAIARALVRNPAILLLDEATSALDPQSENIVQEALDKASSGRTTITIAHRLGAVRNADVIYVVEKGVVKEFGTHEKLMNLKGLYYTMHGEEDQEND